MFLSLYLAFALSVSSQAGHAGGLEDDPVPSAPIGHYFAVKPDNRCKDSRAGSTVVVFRGGRPSVRGLKYLDEQKIHEDMDLEPKGTFDNELKLASRADVHFRLEDESFGDGFGPPKTADGKDDNDRVIAAIAQMRNPANSPIYVHCKAGRDRTGMALAFHRVFNECWDPRDAEAEWNQLEGFLGRIFHHPKHLYFRKVTSDPKLTRYFKSKLEQSDIVSSMMALHLRNSPPPIDLGVELSTQAATPIQEQLSSTSSPPSISAVSPF